MAAGEELHVSSELNRLPCGQLGVRVYRHDQQHGIFVAIIDDAGRVLQPSRSWPLDSSCSQTNRQMPINARRFTRVTGIDPVNMPALFELETQSNVELLSLCDRPFLDPLLLSNKLQRAMRNRCGRSSRARSRPQQANSKRTEQARAQTKLSHSCFDARSRALAAKSSRNRRTCVDRLARLDECLHPAQNTDPSVRMILGIFRRTRKACMTDLY